MISQYTIDDCLSWNRQNNCAATYFETLQQCPVRDAEVCLLPLLKQNRNVRFLLEHIKDSVCIMTYVFTQE